jgi:hypothetical protein
VAPGPRAAQLYVARDDDSRCALALTGAGGSQDFESALEDVLDDLRRPGGDPEAALQVGLMLEAARNRGDPAGYEWVAEPLRAACCGTAGVVA